MTARPAKNYEQEKFELIFENLPIAIWEEDLSALAKLRKYLKEKEVVNIRNYLSQNPELVKKTFHNIRILDVNNAALKLYGAKSKKELIGNFGKTFNKEAFEIIIDEFATLLEGRLYFSAEFKSRTLTGKFYDVLLHVSVPERYQHTLERVIVTLEDISERKKLERNLRQRAQIDGLTKLLNHNAVTQRLEEEVLRAKRYKLSLSCFMIDLDQFKIINDEFGHQKGDQILKRVAGLIKSSLRGVDIVGRYGGDEFLVILPETKAINAKIAAARIQQNFARKNFSYKKGMTFKITLSIGISGYPAPGINDAREMMGHADRAMYKAKRTGRNRIVLL